MTASSMPPDHLQGPHERVCQVTRYGAKSCVAEDSEFIWSGLIDGVSIAQLGDRILGDDRDDCHNVSDLKGYRLYSRNLSSFTIAFLSDEISPSGNLVMHECKAANAWPAVLKFQASDLLASELSHYGTAAGSWVQE